MWVDIEFWKDMLHLQDYTVSQPEDHIHARKKAGQSFSCATSLRCTLNFYSEKNILKETAEIHRIAQN
jgi:hypothetical protein